MGRTRNHLIHLRLDDAEYAALVRNAKKCSLPQQTYLRYMVKNTVPKESPTADFFECNRRLQHIGLELSALALDAKCRGETDTQRYFAIADSVQKQIHQLFNTIMFPEWIEEKLPMKTNNSVGTENR